MCRNNPDAALQGGGMTRAEREALMAKLEQSQRDLAEANRKVEEANTKLDDVINDEQLFKRLASAKHGPATGPAGKGANQESHLISEDELVALQEQAFRADEAERELDKMRSKLMLMEEDSKNGKKVPGLLKEIESLNEKINKQKDLAERHRQEHNRIVTDLKNHKIQVKSLTVETEKLQSELSKLQEELRKLQTKVEEQDHRIALLQGELEVMTNEEGAQRSRADSLSEEKDRLIAEQTKMESLRADREKTISELESAAEQMRQEAKRLNNTKTELEKQFRHAKSRITEVEERERKYKEQSETTMRKLEGRLEELQDQLKNLGQVRVQFNDLQKKYMADLGESNAKIEELTKQFQNVSVELAETKSLADAHQKIVGLYYHKINHKISVPPRKVLFKVWHLFTVACKYWNADERHKAMEAAVRKSKYESKSLRLRLGAAHRLVEEMQRRDKSISCASTLLAPPPSVDGSETAKASERLVASDCSSVLGASDGPSVQHLKGPGAIGGTSATSTDRSAYGKSQDTSPTLRAPDKDAAMKDTKVQDQAHGPEGGNEVQQHARAASSEHSQDSAKQCTQCSEIEGIKQRNTRLQANVMKLEEQAKKLGEHNDDLNAQLMDLKKYVPSIAVLPTIC
jgi:DNA repair exonuclease SbcCD ATPase subunit